MGDRGGRRGGRGVTSLGSSQEKGGARVGGESQSDTARRGGGQRSDCWTPHEVASDLDLGSFCGGGEPGGA